MIRAEDDPFVLAKKFCYSHNIDPKIISTLGNNIRNIQRSEFAYQEEYSTLFQPDPPHKYSDSNKENFSNLSNLRTLDSGLKKSKATKSSHQKHNTTFNNDTTFEHYPNSHSQANLSRTTVFDRLYNDSKHKKTRRDKSKDEFQQLSKSVSRDASMISCAS